MPLGGICADVAAGPSHGNLKSWHVTTPDHLQLPFSCAVGDFFRATAREAQKIIYYLQDSGRSQCSVPASCDFSAVVQKALWANNRNQNCQEAKHVATGGRNVYSSFFKPADTLSLKRELWIPPASPFSFAFNHHISYFSLQNPHFFLCVCSQTSSWHLQE